ncbi:hypothetical protein [Legionella worsleiensis]|nr:hypothetical protein [Legionella worsleiensis]
MAVCKQVQKGTADLTMIMGKILMYSGGAGLLIMAAFGTVAIDVVLLAYANKNHNSFLTGFLIGALFWGPRVDPLPLLIASPITSLIAVGLSVLLGVPMVGAAILAGWAMAAVVMGVGYGLMALADVMQPEPSLYGEIESCCFCP